MRSLHYYLVGTGTWFAGFGLQSVLFAWLVTMVLRESPENVGIAQMALLLPGTLFILIGGSFADRHGGRRIAALAQLAAAVAPVFLLGALLLDALSFGVMLCYAVLLGTAQAFVTPGRDGLLNQVAAGRVQRTVMLASIAQFGMQIVGTLMASMADFVGPEPLLTLQAALLLLGAFAFTRVQTPAPGAAAKTEAAVARPSILALVVEGAKAVFAHPALRIIVVQNVAMALFFMGSFIVTIPLLVREVFAGTASDLARVNAANAAGLVITVLVLLRIGGVRRQGRALILSQLIGCVSLALAAFMPTYLGFIAVLFVWGICGGVAMTMSRTIMQEQAPQAMQGRVMSFYGFSFMGAGPIGALLSGYLVAALGPQQALVASAVGMLLVVSVVALSSGLWRIASTEHATSV
ncbi:MAG: MFS transporter [Pseudomonadales bacterium]